MADDYGLDILQLEELSTIRDNIDEVATTAIRTGIKEEDWQKVERSMNRLAELRSDLDKLAREAGGDVANKLKRQSNALGKLIATGQAAARDKDTTAANGVLSSLYDMFDRLDRIFESQGGGELLGL